MPGAVRIAIVGSCVSRDPFEFEAPKTTRITSYLARQSFAGLADPRLGHEDAWYADLNGFEKRCVLADLTKGDAYWAFEADADFLVVDYIDERFDLLRAGATHVSDTKHVRQPGFMARYGDTIVACPRWSPETTERWRAGAHRFFERALRTFRPERIILNESRWAPAFRAADGAVSPFGPPYAAAIEPNNRLLEEYFSITKRLVPGISVIRPPEDVLFADPEHRWSKEPFHYVPACYLWFVERLRALTARQGDAAAGAGG